LPRFGALCALGGAAAALAATMTTHATTTHDARQSLFPIRRLLPNRR
jgi:hypothetical protein